MDRSLEFLPLGVLMSAKSHRPRGGQIGNHRLISYNVSLLHRLIRTWQLTSDRSDARHRRAVDKLAQQLTITPNPNQIQEGPC